MKKQIKTKHIRISVPLLEELSELKKEDGTPLRFAVDEAVKEYIKAKKSKGVTVEVS